MSWFNEFISLMNQGGPVMWIIFCVAWLAFILIIERTLRLRAWLNQAKVVQANLKSDKNYRPEKLEDDKDSPMSLLYGELDWSVIKDGASLDKQINTHFSELVPKLEGLLPTIAVLGTLLPMLGLLGTVMGMIQVFEAIAIHGTGDPRELADGIGQALLTTASGLLIAIPVVFLHHLLAKRLHLLMVITEQSIHLFRQHYVFMQEAE